MEEVLNATFSALASQSHSRQNIFLGDGAEGQGDVEQHERELAGIEVDRVGFLNTALSALPGTVLRTFLAPIMNVKCGLFRRRRLTEEFILSDKTKLQKMYQESIRILAKALADSSMELFETPFVLNENELAEAVKGKLIPVCYEPGTVLAYPGEFPETSFVHVVLSGSVQVVNYQAQNRKGVIGDSNKRQYFSSNETIRLNGSLGFQPELFRFLSAPIEVPSEGNSDGASTSNVSTAIHRTLWRASRMIGQPTLVATRTELFRAPYVCCVTEALGMEPLRLSTMTAEAAGQSIKGDGIGDMRVTLTMRIRTKELHDVLMMLATAEKNKNNNEGKDKLNFTTGATRQAHTLAEYIAAARVRAIARHYPLNEILMRQSWLLQDTPAHTIRVLVTNLTPHSYFPGEVILCPHSQNRNLCFLRRGTMTIEDFSLSDTKDKERCRCGDHHRRRNVLEEVPAGASFGELSVLFGEPRQFILRAHTACDVWCLSVQNFAATMRRDDALRQSLLSKAAALRMRWLGEQRYTTSLVQVLRKSCDLFRDASDSFIRLVQERIEPVVYPPGTLLTSTSSRCEEMLIILHGKVASIVDGVAEYGPGGVIGEATIFPHRWPMGLVSKSMVEGWKLTRDDLLDALHRIEILHRHSGEVGAHTTQMMQQIFAPPVPQCESDAVGRSKMPVVGPPPRGSTYMNYAKWLAEVQLKAFCFHFCDYVKWSDISYASLSSKKEGISSKSLKIFEHEISSVARTNEGHSSAVVVGSGANVPRRVKTASPTKNQNEKQGQRQQKRRQKKRRIGFGTTIPFYVNYAIAQQPFTQPFLRKPPTAPKPGEEEPFLVRQRALVAGDNMQLRVAPMHHLARLKALLDNRDKFQKAEAKQNGLNETNKERTEPINVERFGNPAPVHVFLQGSQPRVQITVEEAIAVGYVLQFPDVKNIQLCVSSIDSDVTMGLPQHRQRRRDMAVTPNMRHYRRCFLFAASRLSENSAEEEVVREATARDADSKEKAQHLTTLLMAELPEKGGSVSILTPTTQLIEEMDASLLCNGRLSTKSPSRAAINNAEQSPPGVQQASLTKDVVDEGEVIRELCKDPEKVISKLRMKFHLPPLSVDTAASENCVTHSSFDATATSTSINNLPVRTRRGDLLAHLRNVSQVPDSAIQGVLRFNQSVLQQPWVGNTGETSEKVFEGGDKGKNGCHPVFSSAEKEDMPLFVDGYGQLGVPQAHTSAEGGQPIQTADQFLSTAGLSLSEEYGQAGGKRGSKSAWLPRNFVMPSVSEATTTMRRMQRDVEGLNAVAMEQRNERLSGNARLAERKDPLCANGQLPVEYQRVVDDWGTDYAELARDPLYSTKIPLLLMSEAGTDYLAEEFKQIRQQQLAAVKNVRGVEMWRGEVDMKERRDGKSRDEGRVQVNRSVLADVGAKALGRPSKPLRNPMSHMSQEQYEEWVAKRDAIFENATRRAWSCQNNNNNT